MEDNLFTSQMDEGGLPIANLDHANNPQIIKVIGVGGGGGNAVNHMYNEGIRDVSYVICNTDKKALDDSPVPNKLQLGEGLGAGNKPELARQIAEESIEDINNMLDDGTKMVFITAGLPSLLVAPRRKASSQWVSSPFLSFSKVSKRLTRPWRVWKN